MAYLWNPQTGQLIDSNTGQPVPYETTQPVPQPGQGGGSTYSSYGNPYPSYPYSGTPNNSTYQTALGGGQGGSGGGAAPQYDPSNPSAFINYYYNQTYGTNAPPDQIQYWTQKLQSGETMGNGQPATPAYWAMRLQNPNYADNSSGGMGQYGSNTFGAPLFQASSPFAYGQGVPNVGAYSYDPLNTPQNFQLPTGQDALNQDPGYAFRLQQGETALENSAASRGGLGDPNTLRAVQDYGQQSASGEYQNAYNRALQTYQTNTGTNLQAQQQQYQQGLGAFQTNASTALQQQQQGFNQALTGYQTNFQDPLAAYQAQVQSNLGYGNLGLQTQLGLGGLGVNQGYLGLAANQQAFNQPYQLAQLGLSATGQQQGNNLGYTNGLTNLYGQNANAQGNLYTNQGNANAAGNVASGNAYGNAFANAGNLGASLAYQYYLQHGKPPNSPATAAPQGPY